MACEAACPRVLRWGLAAPPLLGRASRSEAALDCAHALGGGWEARGHGLLKGYEGDETGLLSGGRQAAPECPCPSLGLSWKASHGAHYMSNGKANAFQV